MADHKPKPSRVDAPTDAESPAPEPGQHPKIAETEARPGKAVPNDDAAL